MLLPHFFFFFFSLIVFLFFSSSSISSLLHFLSSLFSLETQINGPQCFRYILQKPPRPLVQADIWFQIGHVHELQKDVCLSPFLYFPLFPQLHSPKRVFLQLGFFLFVLISYIHKIRLVEEETKNTLQNTTKITL
jgi:hypothetical protein